MGSDGFPGHAASRTGDQVLWQVGALQGICSAYSGGSGNRGECAILNHMEPFTMP